jgi:hypothetical protein
VGRSRRGYRSPRRAGAARFSARPGQWRDSCRCGQTCRLLETGVWVRMDHFGVQSDSVGSCLPPPGPPAGRCAWRPPRVFHTDNPPRCPSGIPLGGGLGPMESGRSGPPGVHRACAPDRGRPGACVGMFPGVAAGFARFGPWCCRAVEAPGGVFWPLGVYDPLIQGAAPVYSREKPPNVTRVVYLTYTKHSDLATPKVKN